ncbi:Pre-mRNA-splicing factor of RES complex-domain-containing protein [Dipodascopsis uninucleata]
MSRMEYLAKRYMTAESDSNAKRSKRKRKREDKKSKKASSAGVVLVDVDETSIGHSSSNATNHGVEDDDDDIEFGEDAPVMVEGAASKASAGWKRVGGLRTASEMKESERERKLAQEAKLKAIEKAAGGKQHEVVYRDASGRRIDMEAYKAKEAAENARKEEEERLRREREIELNKGLVQVAEERAAEEREKNMDSVTLARYADDEDLNKQAQDEQRWEDPAATFLTKPKEEIRSATGLRVYEGAFPPNRFNIRPGHLWDGVDRSNGFESRLLDKRRAREARKMEREEAYASDSE